MVPWVLCYAFAIRDLLWLEPETCLLSHNRSVEASVEAQVVGPHLLCLPE